MYYFATLIIFLFSLLIGFLSSEESLLLGGYPLIYYSICLSFSIHWLAFLPSYLYKTEKFYDFIGMLTYISVICMVIYSKYVILGKIDIHSIILSILILVWTLRLGLFLFYRISKAGKDDRFTIIKQSFSHFLVTWTMSAMWVCLSMAAALTVLTSNTNPKHQRIIPKYVKKVNPLFIFEVNTVSAAAIDKHTHIADIVQVTKKCENDCFIKVNLSSFPTFEIL